MSLQSNILAQVIGCVLQNNHTHRPRLMVVADDDSKINSPIVLVNAIPIELIDWLIGLKDKIMTLFGRKSSTAEVAGTKSARAEEALRYLGEMRAPTAVEDIATTFERVKQLYSEEKVITAGKLLEQLEEGIEMNPDDERCVQMQAQIGEGTEAHALFEKLRHEYRMARSNLLQFITNDNWTFSQSTFGMNTWYKKHSEGVLELKMEATYTDVDPRSLFVVAKEADLFHTWIPFCTESRMLKRINRAEILVWAHTPIPMMDRDAVLRGRVFDALDLGFLMLINESVTEFEGVRIPPAPKGRFGDRVWFEDFAVVVEPLGKGSMKIEIIVKVDLKTSLPQTLIEFFTRKVAGMLLHALSTAAKKYHSKPSKSPYTPLYQADREFYDWLTQNFNDKQAEVDAQQKRH